jgi:two-component system sensor histidine kinase BaeS
MPWGEREWNRDQWRDWARGKRWGKRRRWGLRRRLTTWFLIVSLLSVALTTWLTNAAVYRARLELANALPPDVVGFQLPSNPFERPSIIIKNPRYQAANEAFQNVTRTALFAGIGAFILSGFAAAIVTRRLTRPLLALEAAAGRLERGEPGVKLAVPESRDELRTVTEAFNRLTEGLERQQAWRKRVVADIAHDLRTPLSVMRSEIEAMQDGVRPMDAQSLERLLGEISLLARMVEDLRTLERAEDGMTFAMDTLEVGALLREVADSFRVRAERTGFGVHFEPLPTPVQIRGDAVQLTRVLNNILENALEHSGGTRVTLGASLEGTQAVIRVRDNGRGIADPTRIFERFYRGDESRTRDPDGRAHSGLGLSIAKAIVEAHGGSLVASSEPSSGATFELRLPTA